MKDLLPLIDSTAIYNLHLWLATRLINELVMHPVIFVLIPILVEWYQMKHFAIKVHTDKHTFYVMVWVLRVPKHHLRVSVVVVGELVLSHFVSPPLLLLSSRTPAGGLLFSHGQGRSLGRGIVRRCCSAWSCRQRSRC